MSETFEKNGKYVKREITTQEQTATFPAYSLIRNAELSVSDGGVVNDGSDTVTVTVEIVDGLDVARGETPDVLTGESGTLTLEIDSVEIDVEIASGTGSKDITTTKSAGNTIDVSTVSFDQGPIESDSATIEVIN